ncbi:MAG: ABC transporter permease, partial [Planctomycetota bacterium]
MSHRLYLAWRYLASHPVKTAILVTSVTLILYIPAGLFVLVEQSERRLTARAEATPLIIGMKGSPTELALSSLYFSSDVPETMRYGEVERVADTGFALPIPLTVRFRSQKAPIVGTTLDYFDFRELRLAAGRPFAVLGECVVGAAVAERRGIEPGDHVKSSPEKLYGLAGVYPLKMRVTGVLASSDGPDDDAVFVDVKTAWVIEGLAHGHEDLSSPEAAERVLRRDGDNIVANPSVFEYTEITPDNIDSFHFHGDPATFPITAIIAVPRDAKSSTLLAGRYLDPEERHQVLKPIRVIDELLATVVTVRSFVVAALSMVGVATLATMTLVFLLSIRLRRREIETMVKIGGSRGSIAFVVASEILGVLVAGAVLAATLTALTVWFGSDL